MTTRSFRAVAGLGAAASALALPAMGQAATYTVHVGGGDMKSQIELMQDYPAALTVHDGDQVRFSLEGFHTVVFLKKGTALPPLIISDPVAAPMNDPAGTPYWWAGQKGKALNPKAFMPMGGRVVTPGKTVSTGLAPKPVTLTFPKAGTYVYRCIQHPLMRGVVIVKPRNARVASPKAQEQAGLARRAKDIAAAKRATAAELKALAGSGATVDVGFGDKGFHVMGMLPRTLSVKAGTTVDFRWKGLQEVHTATFGPDAYLDGLIARFGKAGPGQPVPGDALFPSDAPSAAPVVFTGANHGTGVLNSGILLDAPAPGPKSWKVTFATPGTYPYVCIVHGKMMSGTIVVTA